MNKGEADAFAERLAQSHERLGVGRAKASQIAFYIQHLQENLEEVQELAEKDRLDISEDEMQEALSVVRHVLTELDRCEQHATELTNVLDGGER